jgi:hypothetical protein
MSATIARRPIGATFLALALGWLALGGFGNALVWRAANESFRGAESSPLARFLEAASSPLFTIIALTYGGTALAACIGIWRMRPWMTKAFIAWGIAVTVTGAWMVWAIPADLLLGGTIVGVAFVCACTALIWVGYRYVRRIAPPGAL